MIDDNFLGLTTYLRQQHARGNNFLTMSFDKVQALCEITGTALFSNIQLTNDASEKIALGWMLADYVIVDCNPENGCVTFQYNPDKVEYYFLSKHSTTHEQSSHP